MHTRPIVACGLVILVLALPVEVLAQCATGAREFASIGGMGTDRLRVQTHGAFNQGQEIARFWDPADSSLGNNFAGGCRSNDPDQTFGEWWSDMSSVEPGLRGIRGAVAGTNCVANSCPSGDLIVLVEDWGLDGPPGTDDTAYFIALRAPLDAPAAGGNRRWDLALADNPINGPASPTTIDMLEFPVLSVLSAASDPDGLILDVEVEDIANRVYSIDEDGAPLPASSVVASYDVYFVTTLGPSPGRLAVNWTLLETVPYSDGPATFEITTDCINGGLVDCHLAVGLTFQGGTGQPVRSTFVGRSIQLETNFYPPNPAGRVPDGKNVIGEPLRVARDSGQGTSTLTWGASCSAQDTGYAVYSGTLGDFYSHEPLTCSAGNALEYELPDEPDSRYYFVAPVSPPTIFGEQPAEGSYGRASDGSERPQDPFTACMRKAFLECD